jgi:rhamnosyltransferase
MEEGQRVEVAVLLATYNGERFVEEQIRSLAMNITAFNLHWIDDQSSDRTRELVRASCGGVGIRLSEWHDTRRQGVPGAFFHLLERVEADIYLFCDQDDIWQPGKIDSTVLNLSPDIMRPVICFSDPLAFKDGKAGGLYRTLDILRTPLDVALEESRVFMAVVGFGHTEGFTKPLRELFLSHKDIARSHAFMHDMWMYAVALAAGTARLMKDVPTTLYRYHESNASGSFGRWCGSGSGHIKTTWNQHQILRRCIARHAAGFILAAPTFPPGPKLDHLLACARLLVSLDRRQSLNSIFRMVRHRVMWPNIRLALGLALVCLCSDASL